MRRYDEMQLHIMFHMWKTSKQIMNSGDEDDLNTIMLMVALQAESIALKTKKRKKCATTKRCAEKKKWKPDNKE